MGTQPLTDVAKSPRTQSDDMATSLDEHFIASRQRVNTFSSGGSGPQKTLTTFTDYDLLVSTKPATDRVKYSWSGNEGKS